MPGRPGEALGRALLPSARSLLVGWAIAVLAGGAYAAARETSVFAIRHVEVEGAPAPLAGEIGRIAASTRGTSLVALDSAALLGRVSALPTVEGARYDRAFPHTLRIIVRPERPVAVLRAGRSAWLVSANARVVSRLRLHARPELPRIWVPGSTAIALGDTLDSAAGGAAARTLAPLVGTFPARIDAVTLAHGELSFQLRSGVRLRFGAPQDLRLKLAVARQILPRLPSGTAYLDVSVPERPVAGPNPQVSGLP